MLARELGNMRIAALLLGLVFLVGACAPASPTPSGHGLGVDVGPTPAFGTSVAQPPGDISPGTIPTRTESQCPGLESQLYLMTQAPEPLARASELQFRVQGDKIQVLLLLDGEDTAFLAEFGAEVGTQMGTQVQAFVPVDRLCDLANAKGVLAVQPAAQAATQ